VRVFRHWETWECVPAGMYESAPPVGIDTERARALYAEFLGDVARFARAMQRVFDEWPVSCEHFLSNDKINRIAWLGQSAMCIERAIPSTSRGGFKLLSDQKQREANAIAEIYLNHWLTTVESGLQWPGTLPTRRKLTPGVRSRVREYERQWRARGYAEGLPDEVPVVLMRDNLAPSHKALALAILRNDVTGQSLGFTPRPSRYYGILKRLELEGRGGRRSRWPNGF